MRKLDETNNLVAYCVKHDMTYLLQEWDSEKNLPLSTSDVSGGMNKSVWWKCVNGHGWKASIFSRTHGRKCPYCAGVKPIIGVDDFQTLYPVLATEWHPTKNKSLKPTEIKSNSSKDIWWICPNGHEWKGRVSHRVEGAVCPFCAGRKVLSGINDLQTKYPDVAKEWNYQKNGEIVPSDVIFNSSKKVWWICSLSHEWEAPVNSRTKGSGCPYCSSRRLLKGFNDLKTKYPSIAAEWHPTKNGSIKPSDVLSQTNKKYWWICNKGHEWETSPNRRVNNRGCPECSKERKTSFPEQVVFFYLSKQYKAINRYLELRYELDVFLPEINTGIEYDGRYYHSSTQAKQRESRKNRYFHDKSVRVIRIKEGDENSVDGDIVFFKVDQDYTQLSWAINEVLCLLGNERGTVEVDISRDEAEIHDLYIRNEKENSLALKYPELVKEWVFEKNRIDPSMISCASHKKMWWKCAQGHEWKASVDRRRGGHGCPYCSGNKVLIGFNDLQTTKPELVDEWDYAKNYPLLPTEVSAQSHKKVWWKCAVGHEWETIIKSRAYGSGCPICAGRVKKTREQVIDELKKSNPRVELIGDYDGNDTKTQFRCVVCQYKWRTTPYIVLSGHGCPQCSSKKVANMRRKTLETFLREVEAINPGVEILGDYKNTKTKMNVRCRKCDYEWASSPSSLLKGHGCPRCNKTLKRTHEQFVVELNKINPDIEVLGKYENVSTKIEVRCKKCSRVWFTRPYGLLAGYGCVDCALKQSANRRRRSQEQFVEELKTISPDLVVLGKYINCDTKVLIRCTICKNEWSTTPYVLLKGHGCPRCYRDKFAKRRMKTTSVFIEELKNINPNIKVLGEYNGNKTPIPVLCLKCNYQWSATPNFLLRGGGCPQCAKKSRGKARRKTHEQFIEELLNKNNSLQVIGEYKSRREKIRVKCMICGYMWSTQPDGLLGGHGCPQCAKRKMGNKKPIICVETGIKYDSISEAKKLTGISSIAACLTGVCKKAGGFHWKYID